MNRIRAYHQGQRWFRGMIVALCGLPPLYGCGPQRTYVKPVAEVARPPIQIPPDARLAPVALTKVVADIAYDTQVGSFRYVPLMCEPSHSYIVWRRDNRKINSSGDLAERFFKAMKIANYNVVGNPKALFATPADRIQPRFRVGARIDKIALDICESGLLGGNRQSGDGSIRVAWQIQDAVDEHVVYETATDGSAEIQMGDAVASALSPLLSAAFESAARNLAADPGFYKLVSTAGAPTVEPPAGKTLQFRPAQVLRGPITAQMDQLRLGVVTLSAADQHGSGFFISPTLILTNNHVVRGHDIVRVALITGRKLLGEVIRAHAQRDVALVSVESGGHSPLPLRLDPVLKIGEEVYAIGTPLDRALSGTVTKGIVSAFRSNEAGLEDIQADVRINPGNSGGPLLDASGNVVGITYAAIRETATGGATGLNLFIPIRDALDKLGLAPDDAVTGRPAASR